MLGLTFGRPVSGSPVSSLSSITPSASTARPPDPGGLPAKRAASPTRPPRSSPPPDTRNSHRNTGKPTIGKTANSDFRALTSLLSTLDTTHTAFLRDCNQLSYLINSALDKFAQSHPVESAQVKRALADSVSTIVSKQSSNASARTNSIAAPVSHAPATHAQAVPLNNEIDQNKKRVLRATPPPNQGSNDRRVMIRLRVDHLARQLDDFTVREKIRSVIPDASLVQDLWKANSGFTVLAPSPAKAATLIQHSSSISTALEASNVEIQEDWTTFVVGPIPKQL